MYAKLKTNLIGLAAALSFVVVGFSLGEAPGANASGQGITPVDRRAEAPPGHALRFVRGPAAAPGVLR
jgi:hypothetical protein